MLLIGVSCNKDIPGGSAGKYPILFRSMEETRAQATVTTMQGDANGFNVYAFFTTPTATGLSFTKNVKYANAAWTYEHDNQGLEYWIPGAKYWFKAVYPATINHDVDCANSDLKLTISNFDVRNQDDILVAETGELDVDNTLGAPATGSIVNLQFKHLLANVVVKMKSQKEGVTVHKITLGDVDTNCTYDGNDWKGNGNFTELIYNPEQSITLTKGDDYEDVTGGGFLVVPASAMKTLTIETNIKTYNLTIPSGTWEIGTRYTYTIEIKQDDIVFVDGAPYVENWDSENATGSVIIK